MVKQRLVINPKIRILHRKGIIFAGLLSGTIPPIQLAESDIIILSGFLKGGAPQAIASKIQSRMLAKLLPVPPLLKNILDRINQLQQSQILINGSGARKKTLPHSVTLYDCDKSHSLDNNLCLRLSVNFALEPTLAGFQVWSSTSRKYHLLSLELVLLLISFSTGKLVSEVITEKTPIADETSLINSINWLLNIGLLVKSVTKPAITEPPRAVPQPHNLVQASPKGKRWQDMEKYGRIPVYFVPHMPNHYPLALGMIYSSITSYKDGALLQGYQLLPISYMTPGDLFKGPYQKFGKGIWLFSNYVWSVDINLKISSTVKTTDKGNLTIYGGPSTPSYQQACTDFMENNKSVDIAVHGEGEITIAEFLECLSCAENGNITYVSEELEKVDGLTFRSKGDEPEKLIHTNSRSRLEDPDIIPSPYTEGLFGLYDAAVDAAIIESNRGCPFSCTFCDWGSATKQKVRKFDLERVKQEIEWIGRNNVRVLWIADANYGMYNRDIELSQWIVDIKKKYGFPVEVVVNYTKNTTSRLAEIIKIFTAGGIISQGIISIQSTDEVTLDVINRKNIKTEKYDELTKIFADANLPLSTDLMIGLPGITVEAFDRDLQHYFDVDVSVKAYPTKLLPNSPMADPEYIKKYEIKVDKNNFLISCYSYTIEELNAMKTIYNIYVVADGYSTLRYVLRYLQREHNIQALAFLHRLADEIEDSPNRYPSITWVMKYFIIDKCMPGGWKNFYDEIALFAKAAFNIKRDSAFDTVLYVNELVMPDDMITYPLTVQLDHDFVSYFLDQNTKLAFDIKYLKDYPPGNITVDDPDSMVSIDNDYNQYDAHQYFWELRSQIARAKSVSDIKEMKHYASVD